MPRVERLPARVERRTGESDLVMEPQPPAPVGNGFQPLAISPGRDGGAWEWDGEAGWRSPAEDEGAPFPTTPLSPDLVRWLESVRTGTVEMPEPESESLAVG